MKKPRVLIVDDERAVADSLGLVFQKRGFDCRILYSPDDALDCARSFAPQLLLCDLTMPGMGGLIMASIISHENPECRIILLSGDYAALDAAWESSSSICRNNSILTKPIHPDALLDQAHLLLNSTKPGFPAGLPIQ